MFFRHQFFRRCSIEKCKEKSRELCSCCQKKLCSHHLKEHQNRSNSQINPLANQINSLENRFKESNQRILIGNSREKLDQWRENSHQLIEKFYQEKCDELEQLAENHFEQQKKQFEEIGRKFQEENSPESLEILQNQLNQFDQISFQIESRPLTIDPQSISIEESQIRPSHLTSLDNVYRKIQCAGEWGPALVSNDQYLLIDRHPNLCLINRQCEIIKEIPWKFDFIRDMSWSTTLNCFILISRSREIFFIHQKTLAIELIQNIEAQDWSSCTCSDSSLYLTSRRQGTNLFQFNLLSSLELIQRWKPPQSCKQYEQILHSSYQNSKLAFVIAHLSTNLVHFEVRSSVTLDRLWTIQLDLTHSLGQPLIRCSTFSSDQWIIIDNQTSQLIQISKDGQIQTSLKSETSLWNAALFTSHLLVVRTKNSVDFHQL